MNAVELTIDADEASVAPSDADFVLAHLSDLHLSSLVGVRPRELLDKRILGYLSWRHRRRREHRSDVLDALRADLHAKHLDHIAITGDLTHIGLPREFREAADWLASSAAAGRDRRSRAITTRTSREPWHDTFAQWSPYMLGDDRGGARPLRAPRAERSDLAMFPRCASGGTLRSSACRPRSLPRRSSRRAGSASGSSRASIAFSSRPEPPASFASCSASPAGPAHGAVAQVAARRRRAARHPDATRSGAHDCTGHRALFRGDVPRRREQANLAIGVPSASAIGKHVDRHATYHVYRIRREGEAWRLRVAVRAYSLPITLRAGKTDDDSVPRLLRVPDVACCAGLMGAAPA
jgi:hypothetical protein